MDNEIYFGKETINRVSFLREDPEFLIQAISHPDTKLLFLKDTYPLVEGSPKEDLTQPKLLRLRIGSIELIHTYFKSWSVLNRLQSYVLRKFPNIMFLGLMDPEFDSGITGNIFSYSNEKYKGTPYFMVDLTGTKTLFDKYFLDTDKANFSSAIKEITDGISTDALDIYQQLLNHGIKFSILDLRNAIFKLLNEEGSLFSYGKMYLDWLNKQNYCPQCGSPVIKINSGTKLRCTSGEIAEENNKNDLESKGSRVQYKCESKNGSVSNIQFPRIDPVCIIAVVNLQHNKILLGNNLRFPVKNFYSCVAGFMEPGETIETCCEREVWEETGVKCSKVVVAQSQPWPFPVSLMIGCIGIADFNGKDEIIDLGNDAELRDAQWFDFDEIRKILDIQEKKNIDISKEDNAEIILPPKTAIARTLIEMAIHKNFPKL